MLTEALITAALNAAAEIAAYLQTPEGQKDAAEARAHRAELKTWVETVFGQARGIGGVIRVRPE